MESLQRWASAGLTVRIDPAADGDTQMGEDLRLLERAESSADIFTVVRFYSWCPAAASIGRHQERESALDWQYCRDNGIPVVRRPTGGRAVYHAEELTYAVVSNDGPRLVGRGIASTYREIAEALHRGLGKVGIEAGFSRGVSAVELRPHGPSARRNPCFLSPSRDELLHSNRKVVGSAQCRLRRSILQHGSIPLAIDYPRMAAILGCPEIELRSRMISIEEAAGRPVSGEELAQILAAEFLYAFA